MNKTIIFFFLFLFLIGCQKRHEESEIVQLFSSVINHDNIELKKLLHEGVDPNLKDQTGETAIFKAVQENNLDAVKILIKNGAKINIKGDYFKRELLGMAASSGNLEMIKLFLKHGANINSLNGNNATPLINACYRKHPSIVTYLISHGANLKQKNNQGLDALFISVQNKHYECTEILLKHGANVDTTDMNGYTPLLWAAYDNNLRMVKLLLKNNADVNITSNDKRKDTPLMLAVFNKNVNIIKLFLNDKELDINELNARGITALDCAIRAGNTSNKQRREKYDKIIALLKSHGAKTAKELKMGKR